MDDKKGEIRQNYSGIGIGMALGLAIGAGLGAALGNIALGVSLGVAFGVAFGLIFGARRAKATQASSRKDHDHGAERTNRFI